MMEKSEYYNEIKMAASLLFTPYEIGRFILCVEDVDLFIEKCKYQEDSEEYEAYHSGRMEQEIILRQSILKLAKQGSSPAQTLAKKLLDDSKH